MSLVTPVTIANRKGYQLFGMLHEPKERNRNPAIVLLSPGIKSRVAPHRLYVKMTKLFCEMGYIVLRFDPEGLGDSEGEIDERLASDVYGSVELGRHVNDTIDVMNWMQTNLGINRFILSGLCGGAITGLLAGSIDKRVESLLGLGMTCVVSGSKADHDAYMTQGQLDSLRKSYLQKIADPASIIRLLTFRTNYRLMIKSLAQPMTRWLKSGRKQAVKAETEATSKESPQSNLSPYFPEAFLGFLRDRNILLVFSGEDRLYWEYEEKFMTRYREQVAKYSSNLTIDIIKSANHIFSFTEWQNEMLAIAASWLARNDGQIKETTNPR